MQDVHLEVLDADQLRRFVRLLLQLLGEHLGHQGTHDLAADAWALFLPAQGGDEGDAAAAAPAAAQPQPAPAAAAAAAAPVEPQYCLAFSHVCQAQACGNLECVLCKHNPQKRCAGNLRPAPDHTYTVDDIICPACGAVLQVRLTDADGQPLGALPPELHGAELVLGLVDDRKFRDSQQGGAGPLAAAAASMAQHAAPEEVDDYIVRYNKPGDGGRGACPTHTGRACGACPPGADAAVHCLLMQVAGADAAARCVQRKS